MRDKKGEGEEEEPVTFEDYLARNFVRYFAYSARRGRISGPAGKHLAHSVTRRL